MVLSQQRMLKNKIAKAILWLTMFSMAGGSLLFTPQLFKRFGSGGAPKIATINNELLTVSQFRQRASHEAERIQLFRQQVGAQADMMMSSMGMSTDPNEIALQGLIVDALLNEVAGGLGIETSEQMVAKKIQDPMFVLQELRDVVPFSVLDQSGRISIPMLRYYLQINGVTLQDFEQSLAKSIDRSLTRQLIGLGGYVSHAELKRAFEKNYLPREYGILTISLDTYLKKVTGQPYTTEQITAFFDEQNKYIKRYWTPEKRSARVIEFKPELFGIKVTDEDVERFYQDHKKEYLDQPLQVQIRRIVLPVADQSSGDKARETIATVQAELAGHPERFADLAKKYSQDKEFAQKGGLMPFFKKGELDEPVERAAFRLQSDGDISEPIMLEKSMQLIQRAGRKASTYKPLAAVTQEIKNKLIAQRFEQEFQEGARALVNQVTDAKQAVADYAKKHRGTERTVDTSRRDISKLSQKILKTPLNEWGFMLDDAGNGLLIQTTFIEKSVEQPLESIKQQVEKDFNYDRARQAMKKDLAQAKDRAKSVSLATIKNEIGGQLKMTGMLNPEDKEGFEALEKQGIPVDTLLSLRSLGAVASADQGDKMYLFRLESMQPVDEKLFNEKKPELKAELAREQQEAVYRGYIASLGRSATINFVQESDSQRERQAVEDLPL
jgi:hypothetical protein